MIINKKYLAEYSPLPQNYDFTEIFQYVPTAELTWIIPILGEPLYEEINEQVSSNTISPENGTLLTEGNLWRLLGHATVLEGLPFLWVNISQVGLTLGKSENSDSATLKDLTFIQSHLRSHVETLKDAVIKFLDDHHESYPLYQPKNCGCNDNCSCQPKGHLNSPNPMVQLYTPPRKDIDIK